MNKNLCALIIIVLIIPNNIYSQTRTLDAKIIMKDNDTINAKMKVIVNLFDSSILRETSFNKKLRIIDDTGKK